MWEPPGNLSPKPLRKVDKTNHLTFTLDRQRVIVPPLAPCAKDGPQPPQENIDDFDPPPGFLELIEEGAKPPHTYSPRYDAQKQAEKFEDSSALDRAVQKIKNLF